MFANANSIVQLAIQTENGIMKHANVSVKIIIDANVSTSSDLMKVRY